MPASARVRSDQAKGIKMKVSKLIVCDKTITARALKLLLVFFSLRDIKTGIVHVKRSTLKRILAIKNDAILKCALTLLENKSLIKKSGRSTHIKVIKRGGRKKVIRTVSYRYLVKEPETQFFFLPSHHISYLDQERHKQPGKAMKLTGCALRLWLYLHLKFSEAQDKDEDLKNSPDGYGHLFLEVLPAQKKLGFRNFSRYFTELARVDLICMREFDEYGRQELDILDPYFKRPKPSQGSCEDMQDPMTINPELMNDTIEVFVEVTTDEGIENKAMLKGLMKEYGCHWVRDALYMQFSAPRFSAKELRGILNKWLKHGKYIALCDQNILDFYDRKAEDLASWLMEHRGELLRKTDDPAYYQNIHFRDGSYIPRCDDKFSLHIPDYPDGRAFYRVLEILKEKYSIPEAAKREFDKLCMRYGIRLIAHLYTMLTDRWSGTEQIKTEDSKIRWVAEKCKQYSRPGKRWTFYRSRDGQMIGIGISSDRRNELIERYGCKCYAVAETIPVISTER
jgi:hypothetical protein